MSEFITAVNANGEKQRIPSHWLEDGSRFAKNFRLPPSQRAGEPSLDWTKNDLIAHAEERHVDLDGATTKADILARIVGA